MTSVKSRARSIRSGGNLLEGAPVKKGDVLYSRRTGIRATVTGFKGTGRDRLVRLSSFPTSTRLSTLTSVAANYTRRDPWAF